MKALLSVADRHSVDSAGIAQIARVKGLAALSGNPHDMADELASSRVARVIKADVSGHTTANSETLLDRQIIVGAFISLLRNNSAFYRALESMVRVPFHTRVSSVTLGATAWIVGEGDPVPVSRTTLVNLYLDASKAAGMLVVSEELLRGTQSEAFLTRELRRAIAAEVDKTFFTDIIDGDTPTFASSGAGADAAVLDLRRLIEAANLSGESMPLIAMHPKTVQTAATLQKTAGGDQFPDLGLKGGQIWDVPVMPSDGLAAGEVVLLDGARIAGEAGDIEIDASAEAAVEMSSTPSQEGSAAVAMVSMFQTNNVAIRGVASFAAQRIADDAVTKLTGADWGEPLTVGS